MKTSSSAEPPGLPQTRVPRIPGHPAPASGFPQDLARRIQKGESTARGFRSTLERAAAIWKVSEKFTVTAASRNDHLPHGRWGCLQLLSYDCMICLLEVLFISLRSFCLSHLVGDVSWTVSSGGARLKLGDVDPIVRERVKETPTNAWIKLSRT